MSAMWLQRLVEQGAISAAQLAQAEKMATEMGLSTISALIRLGHASGIVLAKAQAEACGCEFVRLEGREIPVEVVELIPRSIAAENTLMPLSRTDGVLLIALAD